MFLTTNYKTKAIPASDANLAPVPSNQVRILEPEDGGGSLPTIVSVGCTKEANFIHKEGFMY